MVTQSMQTTAPLEALPSEGPGPRLAGAATPWVTALTALLNSHLSRGEPASAGPIMWGESIMSDRCLSDRIILNCGAGG